MFWRYVQKSPRGPNSKSQTCPVAVPDCTIIQGSVECSSAWSGNGTLKLLLEQLCSDPSPDVGPVATTASFLFLSLAVVILRVGVCRAW